MIETQKIIKKFINIFFKEDTFYYNILFKTYNHLLYDHLYYFLVESIPDFDKSYPNYQERKDIKWIVDNSKNSKYIKNSNDKGYFELDGKTYTNRVTENGSNQDTTNLLIILYNNIDKDGNIINSNNLKSTYSITNIRNKSDKHITNMRDFKFNLYFESFFNLNKIPIINNDNKTFKFGYIGISNMLKFFSWTRTKSERKPKNKKILSLPLRQYNKYSNETILKQFIYCIEYLLDKKDINEEDFENVSSTNSLDKINQYIDIISNKEKVNIHILKGYKLGKTKLEPVSGTIIVDKAYSRNIFIYIIFSSINKKKIKLEPVIFIKANNIYKSNKLNDNFFKKELDKDDILIQYFNKNNGNNNLIENFNNYIKEELKTIFKRGVDESGDIFDKQLIKQLSFSKKDEKENEKLKEFIKKIIRLGIQSYLVSPVFSYNDRSIFYRTKCEDTFKSLYKVISEKIIDSKFINIKPPSHLIQTLNTPPGSSLSIDNEILYNSLDIGSFLNVIEIDKNKYLLGEPYFCQKTNMYFQNLYELSGSLYGKIKYIEKISYPLNNYSTDIFRC